jgi:hypothetical protein
VLARIGAGHVAGEMRHGVTVGDIDIELIECVAAEVLEVLLHLHLDIVPRQIRSQLIAIDAELIRNGREKNLRRHERASTSWTRLTFFASERYRRVFRRYTSAA